ncbi:MAG: hypothetical protein ACJ8F7_09415 [Gemmataceae bacterium]
MATIAIVPDPETPAGTGYRAVSNGHQSVGKTPGEALDSLNGQLGEGEAGSRFLVLSIGPDRFFTAAQRQRLGELMQKWRAVRDAGGALPPAEQAELDALTAAELQGATARASELTRGLKP